MWPEGFLALGDSYTIGEGVCEAERWPAQLAALLRDQGADLGTPRILAKTGWATDELSAAIDALETTESLGPYRLVSLLIGVNNQYCERSLAEYEVQFTALLERAIAFAGGEPAHVLVLAIPDWGVTPFAMQSGRDRTQIADQLDAFNAAAAHIAEEKGARFVDTAPVSRQRGGEANMLAHDGLHPSGALYALWAEAALHRLQS